MRRRVAGVVALVLLLPAAVVVGEVQLARTGPESDPPPPGVDGCYGCDGVASERVVWLGDSTAAGQGASSPGEVVGPQVARILSRPTQLIDLAVSGATIADVVEEQLPRLVGLGSFDVVAISVGANDASHLTRTSTFRRRFRQLLDGLPDGSRVVVLGVPDMGAPPRLRQPLRAILGLRGRQIDDVVEAETARQGAIYVDIAGRTGPRFRADRSLFAADRYHPGDRGYRLWADAVAARWPAA